MPLQEFKPDYPELCETLLRIRRGGRPGHAYLFVGDDHELTGRLARAWLQGFACRCPEQDGDACGKCDRCRQFKAASYPYLQVLQPKSKMRQILIDDIRTFEHQLHLTAGGNAFKAGLVMEADRLNEQAQNGLLKTLEEPPPATMIILVSSQPRRLLPTINSRCQRVSLLRNRRSYEFAQSRGLFPLLAAMRRGAGAATAVRAASHLRSLFAGLETQARAIVEADSEPANASMVEQDSGLQKRLKEIQDARIVAEYRGLRNQLVEAIHTWYLQQYLLASGVAAEQLPHPELLAPAAENQEQAVAEQSGEDWEKAVSAAEQLQRLLNGNMDEKLALQAFCLEVCEKAVTP